MRTNEIELPEYIEGIKVLSYQEIDKNFKVGESEIQKTLLKSNHADNYWHPYDENGFNEEQVLFAVNLFRKTFPDIEIIDRNGYDYTEFYLNTIEKHVLAYSLIYHFIIKKEN